MMHLLLLRNGNQSPKLEESLTRRQELLARRKAIQREDEATVALAKGSPGSPMTILDQQRRELRNEFDFQD